LEVWEVLSLDPGRVDPWSVRSKASPRRGTSAIEDASEAPGPNPSPPIRV
jgi:hypothetical protein